MKRAWIIVLTCLPLLLSACTEPSTSMVFLGEGVTVPKKVMVIPFDADLSIAIQATAQFAGALRSLGFEVVERPLEEMLGDSILTSETRIKLKEQIG